LTSTTPTPSPTVPHLTPHSPLWGIFGPAAINHTRVSPRAVVNSDVAVIPSSLKDFALAVFSPSASASASPSPTAELHGGYSRAKAREFECRWPEKVKTTKDLALRAEPLVPQLASHAHISHIASSEPKVTVPEYALSVRPADAISQFFDVDSLLRGVQNDVAELIEALDELTRVISYHTSHLVERTMTSVQILKEGFQYRNDRARGKAREFRERGNQLLSSAGKHLRSFAADHIKGRADRAKERAQVIRRTYLV